MLRWVRLSKYCDMTNETHDGVVNRVRTGELIESGDGYHIGAEHDQFYCYQTDHPLSQEDVQKMLTLGWFQPDSGISEDGGKYDPENGWSAFT